MALSVLALIFLAALLAIAAFGFRAIIRQGKPADEINKEKCSVCRTQYHRSQLIERQVGDHRILFFCQACVMSLHNEMVSKN